ncbi:MAG: TraB/GumN family protein [bacterium]|nr:TraB/GumN family protein [bacterium]
MKMLCRRSLIGLLILFISLTAVYGQGKSFLWKVESGSDTAYLLGSIHMMKKEHYPLKSTIENAFNQCDILGVEINMSGPKAMVAGFRLLEKGSYTGDETLEDNISRETFRLLQKKLEKSALDYGTVKKMKAWMVATLFLQLEMIKMGFDSAYGIDMYFLNKANAGKKQIVELESIEFQISMFSNFSKEDSEQYLRSTLLDTDQLKNQMDQVVNAWMKGDVPALEAFLTDNVKKYPELEKIYKKINDDRNVGMTDKVISYLRSGKRHFVVVGAAHMVGPKGIVQLLKNKGYTVTQL